MLAKVGRVLEALAASRANVAFFIAVGVAYVRFWQNIVSWSGASIEKVNGCALRLSFVLNDCPQFSGHGKGLSSLCFTRCVVKACLLGQSLPQCIHLCSSTATLKIEVVSSRLQDKSPRDVDFSSPTIRILTRTRMYFNMSPDF